MREPCVTPARQIPVGAVLVGGRYDGARVIQASVLLAAPDPAKVVLLIATSGGQGYWPVPVAVSCRAEDLLAWLPPDGPS